MQRQIINKNNREMEKCPFKPEIQKFKFSSQQQEIMSAPVFDRLYVEGKLQNIMKDETIQKHIEFVNEFVYSFGHQTLFRFKLINNIKQTKAGKKPGFSDRSGFPVLAPGKRRKSANIFH
ncbi:Hypothetical_protein [Hexamita inflata]|uniref:Hypothetical_protein n=1 Tax=Hexamita inflata TaxID=28002 RepID=A0AA86TPT8_9EUKA|nr:Hypothetical protein HINF_LOCUS11490 [Hexamita inflata]